MRDPRRVLIGFVIAAVTALGMSATGAARAAGSTSGPGLRVHTATLVAALTCHGAATSGATPVLLVPGTTLTPSVNFAWNYEKVFTATHRSWCAVTLPHHAMSDAQLSAEYVVYAVRALHARAHRRISILGYSQGGMLPRWAVKFWPDTRRMVDDLVSLDASNHGTIDAYAACAIGGCAPALWQQQTGSAFLKRLNASRETYAGISYTQIYSRTDEVVVPNAGPRASSSLRTGAGLIANVAVQSICPIHLAGHLTMGTVDPVGYALVVDALTHTGTARTSRVSRRVCLRATMPGVSLASATLNLARVTATAAAQVATYPHVRHEPALAPYAR